MCIKHRHMFENYTDCFFNNKIMLKSQQRFKSDRHDVYTKQISKIALAVMMIRDYKHLIGLQHICMEQTYLKYMKVKG